MRDHGDLQALGHDVEVDEPERWNVGGHGGRGNAVVSEGTALDLTATRSTTRDIAGATRRAGEGDSRRMRRREEWRERGTRRARWTSNDGRALLETAAEAARRRAFGRLRKRRKKVILPRRRRTVRSDLLDRHSLSIPSRSATPRRLKIIFWGQNTGQGERRRHVREKAESSPAADGTRIDRASARPTKPSEGRSTRHRTLPRGPFEPVAARR